MSFRPVLPWPDSPGWWWMNATPDEEPLIIKAVEHDGKYLFRYGFTQLTQDEWNAANPPARFVKLTEQSPFPESA